MLYACELSVFLSGKLFQGLCFPLGGLGFAHLVTHRKVNVCLMFPRPGSRLSVFAERFVLKPSDQKFGPKLLVGA